MRYLFGDRGQNAAGDRSAVSLFIKTHGQAVCPCVFPYLQKTSFMPSAKALRSISSRTSVFLVGKRKSL